MKKSLLKRFEINGLEIHNFLDKDFDMNLNLTSILTLLSSIRSKIKGLFMHKKRCSKCGALARLGKKEKKIEKVMHEYKEGELHSGSKKGPKVRKRKQAIAIALNEGRRAVRRSK